MDPTKQMSVSVAMMNMIGNADFLADTMHHGEGYRVTHFKRQRFSALFMKIGSTGHNHLAGKPNFKTF